MNNNKMVRVSEEKMNRLKNRLMAGSNISYSNRYALLDAPFLDCRFPELPDHTIQMNDAFVELELLLCNIGTGLITIERVNILFGGDHQADCLSDTPLPWNLQWHQGVFKAIVTILRPKMLPGVYPCEFQLINDLQRVIWRVPLEMIVSRPAKTGIEIYPKHIEVPLHTLIQACNGQSGSIGKAVLFNGKKQSCDLTVDYDRSLFYVSPDCLHLESLEAGILEIVLRGSPQRAIGTRSAITISSSSDLQMDTIQQQIGIYF